MILCMDVFHCFPIFTKQHSLGSAARGILPDGFRGVHAKTIHANALVLRTVNGGRFPRNRTKQVIFSEIINEKLDKTGIFNSEIDVD